MYIGILFFRCSNLITIHPYMVKCQRKVEKYPSMIDVCLTETFHPILL